MRLLLDTHVWLWARTEPQRLGEAARELLEDPDTDLYLSAASTWEIAIKYSLGKLPLPTPPAEYVPRRMQTSGVLPLAVEHAHAVHVATLPLHHRDPFDRLLIVQAQVERMRLLTADPAFEAYDVEVVKAA
ncbi:MAG: type II toxin-antitoxin system VapC family toxin [Solirubrobacteraceae bacterium MAG38_C4-C5]|nr:type II toxin-antitoxin system VapC family toxin [Candidatus Siliceabacter maunaloa]